MFDTVCSFPLTSDLFSQAIHPTEPLIAVGLSSGHVHALRLPALDDETGDNGQGSPAKNGFGQIETAWRTRRHKGSCRTVTFSHDGRALYSAGTDGLVKAAATETGQVQDKIAIPITVSPGKELDPPTLLHALTPQTLLLATDSSALHVYDLRANENTFAARRPQQTYHPHEDYIASIAPLPPTDASTTGFSKQWVSTGGTTLAVTDLRRGVLVQSEDQEEELLSALYVSGLPARGTSRGEKILVGGASGVLTLWEKGVWDDQDERIIVDKSPGGGESLDVMTLVPEAVGPGGKVVAVGVGDGTVKFVKLGANKIVDVVQHHEHEGVVSLGFDVCGRMITGGGEIIKVWHEAEQVVENAESTAAKRTLDVGDEEEKAAEGSEVDEDSEEEKTKKRKKRRRGKGKDRSGGKQVAAISGLT
ncbi:MAG: WD repeat-containing protein jip5 [Bathelium mastoideum]|nr:MAG: WD repeat-containing protein jip5 [Bathelium mastoideum]